MVETAGRSRRLGLGPGARHRWFFLLLPPLLGWLLGGPVVAAWAAAAAAGGWILRGLGDRFGSQPGGSRPRGPRGSAPRSRDPSSAPVPALLREGARILVESAARVPAGVAALALGQIRARVCLGCPRRRGCWEGEAPAARLLGEALRGGPGVALLPRRLACLRPEGVRLALEVARPLAELAELHRLRHEESRLGLAAHLWELARTAERMAAAPLAEAGAARAGLPLQYRLEVFKRAAPGRIVSGDAHLVWEDQGGGRLLVALSDGMGRGLRAARLSRFVVAWLQRLARGGVGVPQAMSLINVLLGLAGPGEETVSLDVAEVDLVGGQATLFKAGAPPSYLLRRGSPRTLAAPAAPLGAVAEGTCGVVDCTFQPGDVFVMLSDGILEAMPAEGWIEEWLSGWAAGPGRPWELAEGLLTAAARGSTGREDDRSVLVLTFARGPAV